MPWSPWATEPYPGIGAHWKARFGARVQRVSLDPGFACPQQRGDAGGCIYCRADSFVPPQLLQQRTRPVADQLRAGIQRLRSAGTTRFAAYFQPRTNTNAPLSRLRADWDAVLSLPDVVALCVGTRPDCVANPVLDLLARYREHCEVWLELGLQSSHDATLRRVQRGHTAAQFADACRRARQRGLLVCAHVILGLPGEDPEMEASTADFLLDLGAEGVKLHHLAVVRGTPLEELWRAGEVGVLEEAEYVERAAAFIQRLSPATVLHRLVGDTRGEHLLAPHYNKGRAVAAIRRRINGPGGAEGTTGREGRGPADGR